MNFNDAFPWVAAAIGGALIGAAAVLLMALLGRIAGISGIASGVMAKTVDMAKGDRGWRVAFLAGLILAGFVLKPIASSTPMPAASPVLLVVAGLLVGFGSVLGGGCTSGHGVCGLGRRSMRSLVATATFMAAGFITVFVVRHVIA